MIIKIFFLLIIFTTAFFSFFICFKKTELGKKNALPILLFLGFLIPFYIRFVVYKNEIFASNDEFNYINILYNFISTHSGVISGPGYVYFLSLINSITKIDFVRLVPTFAFFVTLFSLVILFYFYKTELKSNNKALLSSTLLLTSTYFIWPILEGRPQQLGVLLLFGSSILFYKYISSEKKYFIPFILLYYFTFFYHILTFLIIMGTCFLVIYWRFLNKEENSGKKLLLFTALSFLPLYYFTTPNTFYSEMYGAMFVILSKFPLCLLYLKTNLFLVLISIIILFFVTTLILRYLIPKINLKNITINKKIIVGFILLIISALYLQYSLISEEHNQIYLNSRLYFLFFQSGNILFGSLFIFGFFKTIKTKRTENIFFQFSFALMVIGAIMTVLSALSPAGFNNGLIRIINYWTIFAAPIAIIPLIDFMNQKNKYKIIALNIISLLIIISVVSSSRDPLFFDYKMSYSSNEVSAIKYICETKGYYHIQKNTNGQIIETSSYDWLIDFLKNSKEIKGCKGINISILPNENQNIAFKSGDVTVYELTRDDIKKISTISKNIIIKKDVDMRCPILK